MMAETERGADQQQRIAGSLTSRVDGHSVWGEIRSDWGFDLKCLPQI